MMIQKALKEAGGDRDRALEVLKELGQAAAAKKEDRETNAGRIESYIHGGGKVGVLLELRSETDFVSRNDDFVALSHNIAMHIAAMGSDTVDNLLGETYIKDPSKTIGDLLKEASATFGERLEIRRFVRYEL